MTDIPTIDSNTFPTTVWFNDRRGIGDEGDFSLAGRQIHWHDEDLSHDDVVKAIKNGDCYIVVFTNKFRDRCYINLKRNDDDFNLYADEGFVIDATQPSTQKLLRAIDNEHHVIIQREDGSYSLANEEDGFAPREAVITINDDGTWKLVKMLDEDEDDDE
jgi:hypothetical protein